MGDERPRLGRADDRWNVIACRGFNGMHVVDRADGAPLHFGVLAGALSHALENHIRYGNHGHYAGRRCLAQLVNEDEVLGAGDAQSMSVSCIRRV